MGFKGLAESDQGSTLKSSYIKSSRAHGDTFADDKAVKVKDIGGAKASVAQSATSIPHAP